MGILCEWKTDAAALTAGRLYGSLCAALLYLALWGCWCGVAALSASGVPPLLAGGLLAAALPLVRERRAIWALALGGAALAGALFLARFAASLDGMKLLLNRLFAASEVRQSYLYERFAVSPAAGLGELRWALLPLGILAGLLCGGAGRYRPLTAAVFLLYALPAAWLGVSPAAGWCALFVFAAALPFLRSAPALCAVFLAAALVCAAVFLALPGEDARLSAWDEAMRDRLAAETVAYTDDAAYAARQAGRAVPETQRLFREEAPAPEEDAPDLPLPLLLAILLTALMLFVPAVLSDRLKKRRARNRAGLDDPDPAAGTLAAFLCAMRWLRAGGLSPGNRPYGDCAEDIETAFGPALRESFERALPLWREAAYSAHPPDEAGRGEMLKFLEDVKTAVWAGLGRRERLRVKYVEAL